MVTAEGKLTLFNPQSFPMRKGGATRVFCVGGSTTFGRPYDDTTSFCGWLRELLPVADPSRDWEVINAGGVSYASYRVALLMEELIDYEPDIFVVYSGHNEFLERRTYSQIIATPRALRGVGAIAAKTRIWTAMSGAMEKFSDFTLGAGGRPRHPRRGGDDPPRQRDWAELLHPGRYPERKDLPALPIQPRTDGRHRLFGGRRDHSHQSGLESQGQSAVQVGTGRGSQR